MELLEVMDSVQAVAYIKFRLVMVRIILEMYEWELYLDYGVNILVLTTKQGTL
jgi:hypothetical protein